MYFTGMIADTSLQVGSKRSTNAALKTKKISDMNVVCEVKSQTSQHSKPPAMKTWERKES